MSSNNQETKHEVVFAFVVLILGLIYYKYQAQIIETIIALCLIIGGVLLLFLLGLIGWKVYKWTKKHNNKKGKFDDTPEEINEILQKNQRANLLPKNLTKENQKEQEIIENTKSTFKAHEEQTKYIDYNLKVDGKKGIYKDKELTKEDKQFLAAKGYIISEHVGLYGGRKQKYWLKKRSNEGADHFFITKMIEQEIRKYTGKVWLYQTVKPDLVFETPTRKKIGVEVESGKRLYNDKKAVLEKVRKNNINYGKDGWFFVVVKVRLDKEKYGKYAKTYARKEMPELIKSYFQPQIS